MHDTPPEPTPCMSPALPPAEAADIAALINLALITEMRLRLGLDADGSATIGRAMAMLGAYGQLAHAVRAPGLPWDPGAGEGRALLRTRLRLAQPVLSRLARADS